jgi:predicted acylesterase/phospholipase RssA
MNVLITSGGGAKGAFSVGALRYLVQDSGINQFDFISGTSTGALIAALIAAGKLDTLVDVYLNTVNRDILNPQNLINNVTSGRPYLYGTEPLLRQIETHLPEPDFDRIMQSGITLCLNSVSLQTGRLTVFSNKNLNGNAVYDTIKINTYDDIKKALLGSTNQPVFMDPSVFNGGQYVDGGVREVIPTRIVSDNLPAGQNHNIYILSNNPNKADVLNGTAFNDLFGILSRTLDIFVEEIRLNDIDRISEYALRNSGRVKVWMIFPDRQLDARFSTGLNFDPFEMAVWMNEGRNKARQIITGNQGGFIPNV